jgi:hypothetical protein
MRLGVGGGSAAARAGVDGAKVPEICRRTPTELQREGHNNGGAGFTGLLH